MTAQPDERPILLCRVDCPPSLQEEFDNWTPFHFDDFGRHDAVLAAASYVVLRDYDPETGLPAAFNGQATRFIPYVCTDISGMHEWIGSPIVIGGLDEQTLAREAKFPAIGGEPFNGTMMSVSSVIGSVGENFAGSGPCIVERFEVGESCREAFDRWLEGVHLKRYAALEGWVRIRTFRADRTAPRRFPWNRYLGKGNRMIWCELREGVDVKELVRSPTYRELLADSLQWDGRLPYVTREACECLVLQNLSKIPAA